MKTYAITIKPLTGFGTPIKGDTLLGHICWQAVYDEELFGRSVKNLLSDYAENPFIVVSSAYPEVGDGVYALKRPDLPLDMLFDISAKGKAEIIKRRKELKSKRWMIIKTGHSLNSLKSPDIYLDDEGLFQNIQSVREPTSRRQIQKSFVIEFAQPHNTINRFTGTTGEGRFAPYSVDQIVYMPHAKLSIFVGIRDDISIDHVVKALKRIGETGYGRDASTGLGRFIVADYKKIDLKRLGAESPNACYTLSPCVPETDLFSRTFFSPFVRFGRHGDVLSRSQNPFKNPVIMIDEGAVLIPHSKRVFNKPYIGSAVKNISKAKPETVTQGYSLYIPLRVEVSDE